MIVFLLLCYLALPLQCLKKVLSPYPDSSSQDFIFKRECQPPPSFLKSQVKNNDSWDQQVDRLAPHFKFLWEKLGTFQLIEMTKQPITYQPTLVTTALKLWSSSYNYFIFPFGNMIVTLLNVFILTGLHTLIDDFVCLIDESQYV